MNNFWPCNTPPAQPGGARFRYVFAPVDRHSPQSASRFGAEARLGALAQETSLLDRFPAGRTPRFTEGRLPTLGSPPDCRLTLHSPREDHLTVRLANLRADDNEVTLHIPDGYRPTASGAFQPGPDGTLRLRLPRFGWTELPLRREPAGPGAATG